MFSFDYTNGLNIDVYHAAHGFIGQLGKFDHGWNFIAYGKHNYSNHPDIIAKLKELNNDNF